MGHHAGIEPASKASETFALSTKLMVPIYLV